MNYKNPERGLILAALPGIVVPAMGSWYAEDYPVAIVLSLIRVAGLASLLPGLLNQQDNATVAGGILLGVSYFGDLANTPYAIKKYNQKLKAKTSTKVQLAWSWKF